MKLHTRKNKGGTVYFLDYYDVHGVRRQKTLRGVTSRKEAEMIAAQFAGDLERQKAGIAAYSPKSKVALAEVLALKMQSPGLSDATRERYAQLGKRLGPEFGMLSAGLVGRAEIERFMARREGGGAGATTINKEVAMIRASLNLAFDRGLIHAPPRRFPRLPETKTEQRVLTREEVARLLTEAGRRSRDDYEVLLAFASLGLRPAEMWRAKWDDVDFERGEIRGLTKKRGGGNVFVPFVLPLSDQLREVLRKRRAREGGELIFGVAPEDRNRRKRNASAKSKAGHVRGVAYLGRYGINKRIKAIAKAAGIARPKEISLYTLRHTFATRVAEGATVQVANRLMRHTTLQMTMHYIQSDKGAMREAVNRVVGEKLETSGEV